MAAATDALQAALIPLHGPTKVFRAVTDQDQDRPYVSFLAAGRMVLSVEPYGHGWAALWDSSEDNILAVGETPLEAMRQAVKALRG